MRVFIGGVMQGSRGTGIEDQSYRAAIGAALQTRWPHIEVVDPYVLHPDSVTYDDATAKLTLFTLADMAGDCDLLVVYLPQASMGTALEMYRAYENGVPVYAITPLTENWVVRAIARRVFANVESFVDWLATADELDRR